MRLEKKTAREEPAAVISASCRRHFEVLADVEKILDDLIPGMLRQDHGWVRLCVDTIVPVGISQVTRRLGVGNTTCRTLSSQLSDYSTRVEVSVRPWFCNVHRALTEFTHSSHGQNVIHINRFRRWNTGSRMVVRFLETANAACMSLIQLLESFLFITRFK